MYRILDMSKMRQVISISVSNFIHSYKNIALHFYNQCLNKKPEVNT